MNHSDFKRLEWLESILGGATDRCVYFERLATGNILLKVTDCEGEREHISDNLRVAIDAAMKASEAPF